MDPLKKKFIEKASVLRDEVRSILKTHGDTKIDEVTLRQVYGGARGIKMMIWETSQLDPIEGIRFRGYSIPELKKLLPSGQHGEPKPEGLFWLMLVGCSRTHLIRPLRAAPSSTSPSVLALPAIFSAVS